MILAPISLFAYNRPCHLRKTVEALKRNELSSKTELYIYSDGPRDNHARISVEEVRKYIRTINGFKNVVCIEREKNFGLAGSIINGVTEVVSKHGKVIVMEDDLVCSPYFLKFMNDGLEFYEEENKVISIHGYMYPVKEKLPETFFLKGADCLGWATWKRGWDMFEMDGSKLLNKLIDGGLEVDFNLNNSIDYTGMLKSQIAGKIDSWAIRWYASAFTKDKYTLYPSTSLVRHIGNDSSGTNCGTFDMLDTRIRETPVIVHQIPVEENAIAVNAVEKFFKKNRHSFFKKAKNRIINKLYSIWKKNSEN